MDVDNSETNTNTSNALDDTNRLSQSERELLSILLREGQIARSAVTEHSQLSQQSVHRVLDRLENRGLLNFTAAKITGRGKPSPMVEIASGGYATLGVSFTTESVHVCLLNLKSSPLAQDVLEVDPNEPEEVLLALAEKIECWREKELSHRQLLGIGIAMQGYRNGPSDRFHPPEPLSAWLDLPLINLFQDKFKLPAFVENNATSSATAEFFLGGGRDHECFAYLSFNYGFGVGLFWKRQPIQGGFGNAGEISSIYSEGDAIHRPALGELTKRLTDHDPQFGGIKNLSFDLEANRSTVNLWLKETRPYLCQSLIAIKSILDPTAIFFGGQAPPELRKLLIAEGRSAFEAQQSRCPVLQESHIKGDAAHLGAAILPLHNLVFDR